MIAKLVQADEDTVRDVIHRFTEIGLACLAPRWAGGRPRLLSPDEEDFVVQTATARPTKLGQPFTRWSIRKLAAYLRHVHGRVIRIGREALRCLLTRCGITFQRTKTWKESPDPDRDTKLDRIEHGPGAVPDRVFAFDEFGPLGIRPTAGSCWALASHPRRRPGLPDPPAGIRGDRAMPVQRHRPRRHQPDPDRADPTDLATFVRRHWLIESQRWLRDTAYREDQKTTSTPIPATAPTPSPPSATSPWASSASPRSPKSAPHCNNTPPTAPRSPGCAPRLPALKS